MTSYGEIHRDVKGMYKKFIYLTGTRVSNTAVTMSMQRWPWWYWYSGELWNHSKNILCLVGIDQMSSFSNKCHFHFKVGSCRPKFLKPHHFNNICKIFIKYPPKNSYCEAFMAAMMSWCHSCDLHLHGGHFVQNLTGMSLAVTQGCGLPCL